jgi:hypothetical protein
MGRTLKTRGVINRVEGALLLGTFVAYQAWLILDTHAGMAI